MAVALEAVDLVLIALFLFLLAFLHATKWTIEPLVHSLHSALGWIPGVGGLAGRAENAVIDALNGAISDTEDVISTLWAGFVWSLNELIDGLSWAWGELAGSLEHAFTVTIPHAFVDLYRDATHAGGAALKTVAGVEARILDALKEAKVYAAGEAAHALARAGRYTDAQLSKYAGVIGGEVSSLDLRLRGAEADVQHALDVAERAVAEAVGSPPATITRIIEQAASPELAGLVAGMGAVAGELPQLPGIAWDDAEALLRSREFGTLAGLLAAIPLVNALVHALAAETGLSNAECRAKVKGICGSDPARWAHMLEALTLTFAMPSLDEFAEGVHALLDEVSGAIVGLVGLS